MLSTGHCRDTSIGCVRGVGGHWQKGLEGEDRVKSAIYVMVSRISVRQQSMVLTECQTSREAMCGSHREYSQDKQHAVGYVPRTQSVRPACHSWSPLDGSHLEYS